MTVALCTLAEANDILAGNHYLGPVRHARVCVRTPASVLVFSAPRARNLPVSWVELTRWCILPSEGQASQTWPSVVNLLEGAASTIVSYSDPGQGHTGALYRACNWLWAPTWHRLRPPPTGNGSWAAGKPQSVKDRWVYPLSPDADRANVLAMRDASVEKRYPWAVYREPTWRRGRFNPATGGGAYREWKRLQEADPTCAS